MPEPLGLSFRETMTGGFFLGETDPQTGHDKGVVSGSALALHATVTIDDLDQFVAEATHPGRLDGSVDFAAFGGTLPGSNGVFNLFNPSGQPGLKYMVYELGFGHAGKRYYLAGRKEVRDDTPIQMWRQTTTLYTRLHEGPDATGPIVGAGVLSLGVTDLIHLLNTTTVSGATSPAQQAAAIEKFGRFFVGQLWDSYGVHVGR